MNQHGKRTRNRNSSDQCKYKTLEPVGSQHEKKIKAHSWDTNGQQKIKRGVINKTNENIA